MTGDGRAPHAMASRPALAVLADEGAGGTADRRQEDRRVDDRTSSPQQERAARVQEKLRRELTPLLYTVLTTRPDLVELMLNEDGRVWAEFLGQPMTQVGTLAPHQAEALMATIASTLRTTVTRENPILECELPLDGSRFEGMLPPVVAAPVFAIRRKASRVFTLAEYVADGVMSARQADELARAVLARENVLVVGGTSSGKTTLTNALIEHMAREAPHDRLVVIEDLAEIQCSAPNRVMLRATDTVDMLRLLKATMRLRPDRIVVGEVRRAEALALIKAWNTGHPGGAATVHANDARAGLLRLENLIAEATTAPMQRTIAAAVNLVVFIEKTPAGRRVRELVRVHGYDGRDYTTSRIED